MKINSEKMNSSVLEGEKNPDISVHIKYSDSKKDYRVTCAAKIHIPVAQGRGNVTVRMVPDLRKKISEMNGLPIFRGVVTELGLRFLPIYRPPIETVSKEDRFFEELFPLNEESFQYNEENRSFLSYLLDTE